MGVNLTLKHTLGLQHEDYSVRDTIDKAMRNIQESTSIKRGPIQFLLLGSKGFTGQRH